MSLLNRPPEFNHLYDSEGRLRGGLDALDELGRVIAVGSGEGQDRDNMEDGVDEIEPAMELPITSISRDSPSLIDSDEDMSDGDDPGSSDDEPMEEIAMYDDSAPNAAKSPDLPLPDPPIVVPSSPNAASLPSPAEIAAQGAALAQRRNNSLSSNSESSTPGHRSRSSRRNSRKVTLDSQLETLPIGETLKKRFLDANVLTTVLVRASNCVGTVHLLNGCVGLVLRISLEQFSAQCSL
jgi:serine/threonine-protein phosphatase 6 regulatory subunit 3